MYLPNMGRKALGSWSNDSMPSLQGNPPPPPLPQQNQGIQVSSPQLYKYQTLTFSRYVQFLDSYIFELLEILLLLT